MGENGDGSTNETIVEKEENKEYFFNTVNAIERRACEKSRIKVMAWLKYSDLIVMEEQIREENTMIAMVCTACQVFVFLAKFGRRRSPIYSDSQLFHYIFPVRQLFLQQTQEIHQKF